MNKTFLIFLSAASFFSSPLVAVAEEEIVHSFEFPKGDAAWTVTLEKSGPPSENASPVSTPEPVAKPTPEPGAARRDIKKLDAVRMGNLRRDYITWTDGSTTEYWMVTKPPLALFETAPGGPVGTMRRSQMGARQFDGSLFSWISKSNFRGIDRFKGKKCRRYETKVEILDGEKQTQYAWIDNETLAPAGWSDGVTTAIFSFDIPLPAIPLVLPQKFAQELAFREAYSEPPKKLGRQR